jgi:hypothetical protein
LFCSVVSPKIWAKVLSRLLKSIPSGWSISRLKPYNT